MRIVAQMQASGQQPPDTTAAYPGNAQGFSMDSVIPPPGPQQELVAKDPSFSMTPPVMPVARQKPNILEEAQELRRALGGPPIGEMGPAPQYAQTAPPVPEYARKAALSLETPVTMEPPETAGPEPWQVAADQERFEAKPRLLDMLGGLTEAGQNFSNNIRTSGELMMGIDKSPEYVATGLRGRAAMERDKVSPAQRDYYRSLGVDLPPGLTQGQLKASLPLVDTQLQLPEAMARREQMQQNADRNFALREQSLARLEASARRLPVAQAAELGGMQDSIAQLRQLEQEKAQFDTGPYSDVLHRVGKYAGIQSPEFAAFKAKTQNVLNLALKRISGSQVTAGEAARFEATFPLASDHDAVYMAKLRQAIDLAEQLYQKQIDALGATGRDVSGFEAIEDDSVIEIPAGDLEAIQQATEDGIPFRVR